uniref:Protein kinase domain-containing protein n=1 Tax=Bursaphelenchus xylophilus TaxID=6326 RepID=A0A1I7RPJ4_BURXY
MSQMGDPSFKLDGSPYEVEQIIGIGAYGQVRQAIDVLLKMEPWNRLSADDALSHPYLSLYHVPENEPACPEAVQLDVDAIESLSMQDCLSELGQEARLFQSQRELYPIESV